MFCTLCSAGASAHRVASHPASHLRAWGTSTRGLQTLRCSVLSLVRRFCVKGRATSAIDATGEGMRSLDAPRVCVCVCRGKRITLQRRRWQWFLQIKRLCRAFKPRIEIIPEHCYCSGVGNGRNDCGGCRTHTNRSHRLCMC